MLWHTMMVLGPVGWGHVCHYLHQSQPCMLGAWDSGASILGGSKCSP